MKKINLNQQLKEAVATWLLGNTAKLLCCKSLEYVFKMTTGGNVGYCLVPVENLDKLEINAELLNKSGTETLEAAIRQQYNQIVWQRLCNHEPRLKALHGEILSVKDEGESFCKNALWHGYTDTGESFKSPLCDLVGWSREEHPVLGTHEAYRVACDILRDSLPACRECGCTTVDEWLPMLEASR